MKNLQPSMKENTRYLKFKVHSEKNTEFSDLVETFWENSISHMGENKLSAANPWMIANRYDEEKQEGVVRVNRDFEDDLRAALTLINSIGKEKAFLQVKKVSGSISGV